MHQITIQSLRQLIAGSDQPHRVIEQPTVRLTGCQGQQLVSTKYRCHRLCHLQMSLGSGGGRARSPGMAEVVICTRACEEPLLTRGATSTFGDSRGW
jgi:hypothetical protein